MIANKPKLTTSPQDAFLNLLMLVMMYIAVISIITISIAYIDYLFPDPLSFYLEGNLSSIRWGSSMLVVTFPLFLFLVRIIHNGFRRVPEKHSLKFRKWLVYLTLFVAAITIVIDLIQLVFKFYNGDLTLPFGLKVLAVLLVAGAVFGYFLWDVHSKPYDSPIPIRAALSSGILIIALLVGGFFIVGSPAKQRMLHMDLKRTDHLRIIQNGVVSYRDMKDVLPNGIEDLEMISGVPPVDPDNNLPYEYRVLSPDKFEICSYFSLPSINMEGERARGYYMEPMFAYPTGQNCWQKICVSPPYSDFRHDAGRNCYQFEIIEQSPPVKV